MLNPAEYGDSHLVRAVNASFDFWAWAFSEEGAPQRPNWELARFATQAALLHLPDTEQSYADADEIADLTLIMLREPELYDGFKKILQTHMDGTELSREAYKVFGKLNKLFDTLASRIVHGSHDKN